MTGKQLKEQRERLKLSQPELAKALKTAVGNVRNWEQNRRAIPGVVEIALEYVKLMLERKAA